LNCLGRYSYKLKIWEYLDRKIECFEANLDDRIKKKHWFLAFKSQNGLHCYLKAKPFPFSLIL